MNMFNMLGKFKEIKQKIEETKERLEVMEVEGTSSDGLVRAVATGSRKVLQIDIDESLVHSSKKELEEHVLSAVSDALDKAGAAAESELKEITGGLPIKDLL